VLLSLEVFVAVLADVLCMSLAAEFLVGTASSTNSAVMPLPFFLTLCQASIAPESSAIFTPHRVSV
jgi:hypothetical protein